MSSRDQKDPCFDQEESQRRFEAALRGARAAESLPMKEIPPKRTKKGASKSRTKKTGS
jgi:hypothetical protein